MTDEPQTVREYAQQSERHARRMLKAQRHHLNLVRWARAEAQEDVTDALTRINDTKRVMLENGWTE